MHWISLLEGLPPRTLTLPAGRRHVCEDEPEEPDTYGGVECPDEELTEGRLQRVYGRLRVLSRAREETGKRCWWVRCECGTTRKVRDFDLRANRYQSCGCLRRELRGKK